MLGAVVILTKLGLWAGTLIAARWGIKLALVAAVVAVYVASFAALVAAVLVAKGSLEATFDTFGPLVLQFFPSTSALAGGATIYVGTLATMKALDYWRLSLGVSAKIGTL